jgi:hypothetical protein
MRDLVPHVVRRCRVWYAMDHRQLQPELQVTQIVMYCHGTE